MFYLHRRRFVKSKFNALLRVVLEKLDLELSSISAGNEAWDDYRTYKVQSRSQL